MNPIVSTRAEMSVDCSLYYTNTQPLFQPYIQQTQNCPYVLLARYWNTEYNTVNGQSGSTTKNEWFVELIDAEMN